MPRSRPSAPDDILGMAGLKLSAIRALRRPARGRFKLFALYAQARHWVKNRYRPELHYMRGPGPKTLEKLGIPRD